MTHLKHYLLIFLLFFPVLSLEAINTPNPSINLALDNDTTLTGKSGGKIYRHQKTLRQILFNPAKNNYAEVTDWNLFGNKNYNYGKIGSKYPPFWYRVYWENTKKVNYITFASSTIYNQSFSLWKVQYLNANNVWIDLDSGQGGWLNNGTFSWGGTKQKAITTKGIRLIIYSDGKHDLRGLYLAGQGGESNISKANAKKTKSTLIQYISSNDDVDNNPSTDVEIAQRLSRATFGVNNKDIENVKKLGGYEPWINNQFTIPASSHFKLINNWLPGINWKNPKQNKRIIMQARYDAWLNIVVNNNDQLRQRIAFALSQILVISDKNPYLNGAPDLVANYYDLLVKNAFGNYRDILEKVTLHPAMQIYLSLSHNAKANPKTGTQPDENYAREVMQLFSLGLNELNLDGTEKIYNNMPIPTYTQQDVMSLSKMLTGWTKNKNNFRSDVWISRSAPYQKSLPMVAADNYHDKTEKVFLGHDISAGLSAKQELKLALDIIFNHQNIAPFISKQLIQKLVTSNPSTAYVRRVASIFNNNGNGIRGDMKAVVKAILLDKEALNGAKSYPNTFGRLQDPLIRVSKVWRSMNAVGTTQNNGPYKYKSLSLKYPQGSLEQAAPLTADSVFNYYDSGFSPVLQTSKQTLVLPEFQIASPMSIDTMDRYLINITVASLNASFNLNSFTNLIATPKKLVSKLDLHLTSGHMSNEMKQILETYITKNKKVPAQQLLKRLIALVATSAEFAIQR